MGIKNWSRRQWLLTVACLLVLCLAGMRWQLRRQVHAAVEELEQAGKPTRYADLDARFRQVPNEDNLFTALIPACNALNADNNLSKRLPIIGYASDPAAGEPWPDDMRQAVSEYFAANTEAMAAMRDAFSRTNSALIYSHDWEGEIDPVLHAARHTTRVFALAAIDAAEHEHPADAARDLVFMLRLARAMGAESDFITHLIRFTNERIAVANLERVMAFDVLRTEELVDLRRQLQQSISEISCVPAVEGEVVHFLEPFFYGNGEAWVQPMDSTPAPGTWEYRWEKLKLAGYRMSGLADLDALFFLRTMGEIEALAGAPLPELHRIATTGPMFSAREGLGRFRYWSNSNLNHWSKLLTRHVESKALLIAADAALAVTQYRLQHQGKLPASLGDLVPEYLESVPTEPQSGQPFELIVTADGYGVGRGAPVFSVRLPR